MPRLWSILGENRITQNSIFQTCLAISWCKIKHSVRICHFDANKWFYITELEMESINNLPILSHRRGKLFLDLLYSTHYPPLTKFSLPSFGYSLSFFFSFFLEVGWVGY
jgi:hypothetical protein